MEKIIEALRGAKCVAAMTGAGVSTLCGIPDFRGPKGLYKNPDAERIFDIDWFDRDPSVYYRGCRELVYGLGAFEPGPVHRALKRLEDVGRLDGIITQNIDMLHQKAGSSNVYEVHGSQVEIDYIQKNEVKKVPGKMPGFVIYHTNYSMTISPDISNIKSI